LTWISPLTGAPAVSKRRAYTSYEVSLGLLAHTTTNRPAPSIAIAGAFCVPAVTVSIWNSAACGAPAAS
jgi:hypothetical protein